MMEHRYSFSCQCGKVSGNIFLPKTLSEYSPRECDCDFCMSRGIQYLSDPQGKILVESVANSEPHLEVLKQGSNQADFLQCANCKQVIMTSVGLKNIRMGALNVQTLKSKDQLSEPLSVSPKLLSPQEKLERWQDIWCVLLLNKR